MSSPTDSDDTTCPGCGAAGVNANSRHQKRNCVAASRIATVAGFFTSLPRSRE